ncbi:MAG TPA: hypothetical protein VJZ27_06335 [Aggregatilineales bacterium]|nr:hypothetical protein [Aggregatilineales bacterium]
MSESNQTQIQQLVKEGIEAIKTGDKRVGRGKLEAAVKIDNYNEEAWLWLARVVDTDEERRTCLGNVIIINPQNKQAQRMLDTLEGRAAQTAETREQIMGMSRPLLLSIVGIIVVIIALLVVLVMVLSGGDEEELIVPTVFNTSTPSNTPDNPASQTAAATITPTLTVSPTITPIQNQGAAPTWTPTLGPTETTPPEQMPEPPPETAGRIIMQSGRVAFDPDNQPVVVVEPANLESLFTVSTAGQRGQNPALVAGENRFAWAQYNTSTRSLTLQIQSFGVENSTSVITLYGNDPILDSFNYPDWSGNKLAFSAKLLGSPQYDLWMLTVAGVFAATPVPFGEELTATPTFTASPPPPTVDPLATEEATVEGLVPAETPTSDATVPPPSESGSTLVRITEDSAENTWVRFDPTGTALVYVSELEGVTDLRVVNINSKQQFVLTNNQNALVESAPDWGRTNEIVFSASQGSSELSDIYIMNADGSAEPELLINFGPHDIQPRFSPDGRFVVFSSDKNNNWDVYIYDRQEDTVYGVATDPDSTDIANDWVP